MDSPSTVVIVFADTFSISLLKNVLPLISNVVLSETIKSSPRKVVFPLKVTSPLTSNFPFIITGPSNVESVFDDVFKVSPYIKVLP